MRSKLWFTSIAVVLLAVIMAPPLASAETVKCRSSQHVVKAEVIQVGDVLGHVIGVAEIRGLAFYENGEIAAVLNTSMFDYVNGNGPHQNYTVHTFEDGSIIVIKNQGTTTADPGGKVTWHKGTFTYIGGTGRFAGIQGSGSYTGKRVGPPTAGSEMYADSIGTYTLPAR
jgi:hypothetical protein